MKRGSDFADDAQRWAAKFKTKGDPALLDKAINRYKNALDSLPIKTARYTEALVASGQCCLKRYWQADDLRSLKDSISYFQQALKRLSEKDSLRYRGSAVTLLQAYYALHLKKTDEKTRETASKSYGSAIDALAKLDPRSSSAINALREAFRQPSDFHLVDLHTPIFAKTSNIPRAHWSRDEDSDSALLSLLDVVGRAHLEYDHLDCAIDCTNAASAILVPAKGEAYCRIQEMRGDCHVRRSKRGDDREKDMDEAILCYGRAVESGGLRSPTDAHHNLATALQDRFWMTGDIADVDRAVQLDEDVIRFLRRTYPKHTDHPEYLRARQGLATHLLSRFRRKGEIKDADRAVEIRDEWARKHPLGRKGHKTALGALAAALYTRFSRCGDVADINRVVEIDEELEKLSPAVDPRYHIACLRWLGNSLRFRFEHARAPADLDRSLHYLDQAFSQASQLHAEGPSTALSLSLATTLRYQYKKTNDKAFLRRATGLLSQTLKRDDGGVEDLSLARGKHLLALLECYQDDSNHENGEHCGEADHIAETILKIFPRDHPFHARALTARAKCLSLSVMRHDKTSSHDIRIDKVSEAIRFFKEASFHAASPSLDRLAAACHWGTLAKKWKDTSAMQAHVEILRLLDIAVAQGHSLEKQYMDLKENNTIQAASAFAVEAAALALDGGRPSFAVQLLEQGRGVIFRQLSHLHAELDDVRLVEPQLAARFASLSNQLHALSVSDSESVVEDGECSNDLQVEATQSNNQVYDYNRTVSIYRNVSTEWTEVVEEIRKIRGFHSFLQPASFRELLWAANDGPVIIINISHHRSDAIILIRHLNSPVVVPLPHASLRDVERVADCFGSRPSKLNKSLAVDILRETWRMIGGPVVEKLREPALRVPLGSRIWWCATGAASRLPLHAAGPYDKARTPGMLEMFVSSYTPSLGALIRARITELCQTDTTCPKMLVVGQSATPGEKPLPAARKELQDIQKRASNVTVMDGATATRDAVLQGIAGHEWVHLICHGHHDANRPFYSNFSMYDRSLSLLDLLKRDLPHAELAVLSACHSARVNKDLPDESLHLAAGMMVAGFRSVVATMWALDDEIGPVVMGRFYDEMLGGKDGPRCAMGAASALKNAISITKPNGIPLIPLLQRINFVHYGV